jgi:hypothetical protein
VRFIKYLDQTDFIILFFRFFLLVHRGVLKDRFLQGENSFRENLLIDQNIKKLDFEFSEIEFQAFSSKLNEF